MRQIIAAILVIAGIIIIGFGYLMSGTCGGGYSFLYFAIGALLIGVAVAVMGGYLVLPFVVIAALIFVLYGLELASHAGCAL